MELFLHMSGLCPLSRREVEYYACVNACLSFCKSWLAELCPCVKGGVVVWM